MYLELFLDGNERVVLGGGIGRNHDIMQNRLKLQKQKTKKHTICIYRNIFSYQNQVFTLIICFATVKNLGDESWQTN